MPIRFRCAYCNQLLGIARRKAGTVVRCPTCAGQVVVPPSDVPDPPGPLPQPAPVAPVEQPLFERNDFEDLLNDVDGGAPVLQPAPQPAAAAPPARAPAPAWQPRPEPHFDVERLDGEAAAQPVGIVLSPARATVLTVLVVVGLALAFGAGLLVGYLIWAA
jgi:hypothetical protein